MFKRILLIIFCVLSVILILVGCAIRPFAFSGLIEGDGFPVNSNGLINNVIFYDRFYPYEFLVVNGDGLNWKPDSGHLETYYPQYYSNEFGQLMFSYTAMNQSANPNRNQFIFSDFSKELYYLNAVEVNFNSFNALDYNNLIIKSSFKGDSNTYYRSFSSFTFDIKFNLTETYLNDSGNYVVVNTDVVVPVSRSNGVIDSVNGYALLRSGNYSFSNYEGLNDVSFTTNPSFSDIYDYIQSDWFKLQGHSYNFSNNCVIDNLKVINYTPDDEYSFQGLTIDYDIDNSILSSSINNQVTLEKETVNVNILQWVTDAVQGFLDITIFGNITFGHLILIVIAIPVLIGILKMIAGG